MHYMHYIFLVLFTFIIIQRIHRHLLRMEKYRSPITKKNMLRIFLRLNFDSVTCANYSFSPIFLV